MSLDAVANFSKALVSLGYNAITTSIVLTPGSGARLPTPAPYNVTWWNSTDYSDPADDPNREIVRVTARTDDTITVVRAQEGTLASIKNLSGKEYGIIAGPTAKTITDISSRIDSSVGVFASTFNTNAAVGSTVDLTLTGNVTIANPTGGTDGQTVVWFLKQDATGGRTITLGNKFVIPSSATSPLGFSTTANATDILAAKYRLSSDKWLVVSMVPGY